MNLSLNYNESICQGVTMIPAVFTNTTTWERSPYPIDKNFSNSVVWGATAYLSTHVPLCIPGKPTPGTTTAPPVLFRVQFEASSDVIPAVLFTPVIMSEYQAMVANITGVSPSMVTLTVRSEGTGSVLTATVGAHSEAEANAIVSTVQPALDTGALTVQELPPLTRVQGSLVVLPAEAASTPPPNTQPPAVDTRRDVIAPSRALAPPLAPSLSPLGLWAASGLVACLVLAY